MEGLAVYDVGEAALMRARHGERVEGRCARAFRRVEAADVHEMSGRGQLGKIAGLDRQRTRVAARLNARDRQRSAHYAVAARGDQRRDAGRLGGSREKLAAI